MTAETIERALDTRAIADAAFTGFDVVGELNRVYGGGWKVMGCDDFFAKHPQAYGSLHDYWNEALAYEVPGGVITYGQDIWGAVFIASRDDRLQGPEREAELSKGTLVGDFYRTLEEARAFISQPAASILEEQRQKEARERELQEWATGIVSGLDNQDEERLRALMKVCGAALREGRAA